MYTEWPDVKSASGRSGVANMDNHTTTSVPVDWRRVSRLRMDYLLHNASLTSPKHLKVCHPNVQKLSSKRPSHVKNVLPKRLSPKRLVAQTSVEQLCDAFLCPWLDMVTSLPWSPNEEYSFTFIRPKQFSHCNILFHVSFHQRIHEDYKTQLWIRWYGQSFHDNKHVSTFLSRSQK